MNEELMRFSLMAFVTPLVVVDPPEIVPIFVALTEGLMPLHGAPSSGEPWSLPFFPRYFFSSPEPLKVTALWRIGKGEYFRRISSYKSV